MDGEEGKGSGSGGYDKHKQPSKWANLAMYAEPLELDGMGSVLPDDFSTAWIALAPIPRGKRCLLVAYKSWSQGKRFIFCRANATISIDRLICRVICDVEKSGQRNTVHDISVSCSSRYGVGLYT
jgi:hypothetical protein